MDGEDIRMNTFSTNPHLLVDSLCRELAILQVMHSNMFMLMKNMTWFLAKKRIATM